MKHLRLYVLTLMLMCLVAGAAAAQDSEGLIVGFSQIGSESGFRTAETEDVRAEADRRGITLLFSEGQGQQENQIRALRSFISQGVDAILLAPVVETGWEEVLQEAADAGIPVVLLDRNVAADPSMYLTRVASDFALEGRLAAAWLAQATNGTCRIVELQGTVGSTAAIDRQRGFNEVIALFPGMEIVYSASGDFTRTGGETVMQAYLDEQGAENICAIWGHNDEMIMGAIPVLEDAGLDPGADVLTISVDAVPDIFLAMSEGNANATVELNPHLGAPAFNAIAAHFAGEEVPKWIVMPGGLYFQDTAADEYARRTAQ